MCVNYNFGYFLSNYVIVFLMFCVYGFFIKFLVLFDIIFVIVGMFIIGKFDG